MTIEPYVSFCPAVAEDASELADLRVEAMREGLERVGRFDPVRARERFLSGFVPERTRHILWPGSRVGFLVVKQDEFDNYYVWPGKNALV